jgi:hypothetical protein
MRDAKVKDKRKEVSDVLEFFVQSKVREGTFTHSRQNEEREVTRVKRKSVKKSLHRSKSPSVNDFNLMGLGKQRTTQVSYVFLFNYFFILVSYFM